MFRVALGDAAVVAAIGGAGSGARKHPRCVAKACESGVRFSYLCVCVCLCRSRGEARHAAREKASAAASAPDVSVVSAKLVSRPVGISFSDDAMTVSHEALWVGLLQSSRNLAHIMRVPHAAGNQWFHCCAM